MKTLILITLLCMCLCAESFIRMPLTSGKNLLRKAPLAPLQIALHDAAAAGDMEFVSKIIDQDPRMVSKYDIDGQLPLHHAAKNGHFDLVKYLVEKGPGFINFKNIRYRTALHWSAAYAGYEGFEACEEITFYLINNGADISVENKDGLCPVEYAKKGPLGKAFADRMKEAAKAYGKPRYPVDIALDRVYWG